MFLASDNSAEDSLGKSQNSLVKFINSIDEGFELLELIFDKQGNVEDFVFLEVNPAYEKQTGLKAANVIGKRKKENAPAREQRWYDFAIQAVKTGKTLQYDYYNDKVNRYFETQFIPISTNQIAVMFKDITERKKAEDALKESEERYRSLFSSIDEAFALHEMLFDGQGVPSDYRFLEVNEAFEKQTGLRASEILGKTVCEVLPNLEPFWIETYGKVVISGEPVRFENFNRSLERYYEVYAYRPVQGRFATIFTDITERKKTIEALMQSEIKFRTVADFTYDWEHWISPDGKFIYVSPSSEKITGFKPEEFIDDKDLITKMVHPEDKALIESHYKSIDSKEQPDFDYKIITKSGEVRVIAHACQPVFDSKGLWIGRRGSNRDITERKKAEDALQKQANLIDLSPDAIMVRDFSGTITFWSKGAEKLYGWTRQEALDRNAHKLLQTKFPKPLDEINSQLKVTKNWRGELLHCAKDGHQVIVESRWLIADNDRSSILESNIDITEQRNLQKQLKDSERLAAIGATAGMVGHDIRNPLQAIVSELFLARQVMAEAKDKDSKETLESINLIEEQVDYISKIVSDLQDYARPLKPEYNEVNVEDLLVKVFERVVIPNNVKFKVSVKGTVRFKTDATFIQRAITNLVNNAIQAMPDGGELGLTAYKAENGVVISVSDTGRGIPEDVKANLFTPLMTTKAKGQGLGLAVVKRLVEGLNGQVSFESEEGKGTKFIIELPV